MWCLSLVGLALAGSAAGQVPSTFSVSGLNLANYPVPRLSVYGAIPSDSVYVGDGKQVVSYKTFMNWNQNASFFFWLL